MAGTKSEKEALKPLLEKKVASHARSQTGTLDDKKADPTYQRLKTIFRQMP